MQVLGEGQWINVISAIKKDYEERQEVIKQICKDKDINITCYDLRDEKMLYLLTQHLLYNRKHHSFLP